MYLIAEGLEKIPASKIEKGEDCIKVYDENSAVSHVFQGIPDFSKFSVEGGEFTPAQPDKLMRSQTAMSEISSSLADNHGILAIGHGGTGSATVADALNNLEILDRIYPVGSIYMSVNSTNPSNYFGGTWVSWGQGRVPVGVNSSDSNFSAAEKTGGEKSHTLTVNEIPSHAHTIPGSTVSWGTGVNAVHINESVMLGTTGTNQLLFLSDGETNLKTGEIGGSNAHNNLQPYITCYMWKRTA